MLSTRPDNRRVVLIVLVFNIEVFQIKSIKKKKIEESIWAEVPNKVLPIRLIGAPDCYHNSAGLAPIPTTTSAPNATLLTTQ